MSIISIESYEDVLLDDDGITYEVMAIVEDTVITLPAVYNPPDKASPEERGPGLCWAAITVPHNEDIDPENEEQFKIYLESQNLDWNVYNESVF